MKGRDRRRRVKQRKEACKAFKPGKPVSRGGAEGAEKTGLWGKSPLATFIDEKANLGEGAN